MDPPWEKRWRFLRLWRSQKFLVLPIAVASSILFHKFTVNGSPQVFKGNPFFGGVALCCLLLFSCWTAHFSGLNIIHWLVKPCKTVKPTFILFMVCSSFLVAVNPLESWDCPQTSRRRFHLCGIRPRKDGSWRRWMLQEIQSLPSQRLGVVRT